MMKLKQISVANKITPTTRNTLKTLQTISDVNRILGAYANSDR